jgi:hypothetical protein
MLMEDTAPGSFRRRFHERERRRRLARVALAAAFVLVLGGGLLAAIVTLARSDRSAPDERLVESMAPVESLASAAGVTAEENSAPTSAPASPIEGPVHHHVPPLTHLAIRDAASVTGSPPRRARGEAPPEEPYVLPFALVVAGGDVAALETSLTEVVRRDEAHRALVQNLTFDEARQIEQTFLASAARRPTGGAVRAPLLSGVGDERPEPSASGDARAYWDRVERHVQAMMVTERSGGTIPRAATRRLAGPASLAASYAAQLQLSERGATHTLTVPLAELGALLADVHALDGVRTSLALLPEKRTEAAGTEAVSDWAFQHAQVRAVLSALQAERPGATVLLPLVIE